MPNKLFRKLTFVVVRADIRLQVVDLVELGLRNGLTRLLLLIVLPQIVHHLAVVLVVGELDVLEQETGHWELKLVGFLYLLLYLMAEFGQVLSTL